MSTKVVTGEIRMSYTHLFEPATPLGGGDAKYEITMLIPKSDTATVEKIRAAIREARDAYCAKNGAAALPASPKHPLHDGDGLRDSGEPFGPECKGHWVLKARSKSKPAVVDRTRQPILDSSEIYGGCYGRVAFTLFGYNAAGNKGIGALLLSVQKLKDGPAFGTVGSADDFDDGFLSDGGADDDFLS